MIVTYFVTRYWQTRATKPNVLNNNSWSTVMINGSYDSWKSCLISWFYCWYSFILKLWTIRLFIIHSHFTMYQLTKKSYYFRFIFILCLIHCHSWLSKECAERKDGHNRRQKRKRICSQVQHQRGSRCSIEDAAGAAFERVVSLRCINICAASLRGTFSARHWDLF